MSNNPSINATHSEINRPEINETDKTSNVGRFDTAKRTISQAKDSFTRNAGKVGKGVTTFASDATNYAQQNPGAALAIAVGSGIAIGYLVGSLTRRNTIWTTISAAALGAIADRLR